VRAATRGNGICKAAPPLQPVQEEPQTCFEIPPPHTHKYSKREKERERATIAHQRSALRVSQISRLTAQSGPCSRWLVALSTRDAAGSRAGGVPVTTGYIARPPRPPLTAEQLGEAGRAHDSGALRCRWGSGAVRGTAL
jgi:hypothetical protein